MDDKNDLMLLTKRYQKKIFALILYLIRGDRDRAFEIAASSFVETARVLPGYPEKDVFLTALARTAIEKSRNAEAAPSFDGSGFDGLPSAKRTSLFLTREALLLLPFEARTFLLLRDQLHLTYKNIAAIFRISMNDAQSRTVQSKISLRDKIRKILNDEK